MINLHLIRAAIEAATGQRLPLETIRTLLVEEGLITQRQADEDAKTIFSYDQLFEMERAEVEVDLDPEMGLPDTVLPGS